MFWGTKGFVDGIETGTGPELTTTGEDADWKRSRER
jgi:hypothetical protein